MKEKLTGGGEALPPRRGGVFGLRPYGCGGVTDGAPRISGVMAVRMSGGKLLRPEMKMRYILIFKHFISSKTDFFWGGGATEGGPQISGGLAVRMSGGKRPRPEMEMRYSLRLK